MVFRHRTDHGRSARRLQPAPPQSRCRRRSRRIPMGQRMIGLTAAPARRGSRSASCLASLSTSARHNTLLCAPPVCRRAAATLDPVSEGSKCAGLPAKASKITEQLIHRRVADFEAAAARSLTRARHWSKERFDPDRSSIWGCASLQVADAFVSAKRLSAAAQAGRSSSGVRRFFVSGLAAPLYPGAEAPNRSVLLAIEEHARLLDRAGE